MTEHPLPPGWERVRLDEIAEVRLGRQRSPKNHTGTQMRPYLRAANVDWNGLKLDDVKEMNFTDAEMEVYRLKVGDIVLSEASGSPGEVGKPALWNGEIEKCCFQNTLIRVRPVEIEPKYLLHFFRGQALLGAFTGHARGVGIHHIGASQLASWPIPVPPLPEQHRIVRTLEDYLSRVDVGEQYVRLSEKRLNALIRSSLLTAHEKALDSTSAIRRLGDVAETSLGVMLDKRRNIGIPTPYLRNANVQWHSIDLSELDTVPMTADQQVKYALEPGDLLVCEGGEPGRCAVWQEMKSGIAFQKALHRVRPGPDVDVRWLGLMLEESVRSGRISHLFTGTTIKHLPQEKLRSIEFPIPEISVQMKLISEYEASRQARERVLDSILTARNRAAALRKRLVRDAFSGVLTCQDSGDEPSLELLTRIKARRATPSKVKRTWGATSRSGEPGIASRRVEIPESSQMPTQFEQEELL